MNRLEPTLFFAFAGEDSRVAEYVPPLAVQGV